MACQPSAGGAGPQQAGATTSTGSSTAPEALWMPFIRDMYPKLHGRTYFLPPFHFNRTPQSVTTFAGKTIRVVENPSSIRRGKKSQQTEPTDPSASPQELGNVYTENPANVQSVHVQDSDYQDDEAQQVCLQVLKKIPSQVMIVVSQLFFRKYLDNRSNPERKTNPLHAAAIAQLPTIRDKTIPEKIADGECDILIIHRDHGLVVGEVKSVGYQSERIQYFSRCTVSEQNQTIVDRLLQAVSQLTNQETALRHLVSDMDPIRITKTILLPSITSARLQEAVGTSPDLARALCQCLNCADESEAVRKCLCSDQMEDPLTWWETLLIEGPDQHMSPEIYERLVARFCGPATTVDVATVTPPRRVVRSEPQAVVETGLRFSSLALTPGQVELLNRKPEPRGVYLHGPPGCGKTVVLVLKALQWAQQGMMVHIVSIRPRGRAVSALLEKQLHSSLGAAAASSILRHCYDFENKPEDVGIATSSLVNLSSVGGKPLCLIVDEVGFYSRNQFLQLLINLDTEVTSMFVWAAGLWRFERELTVSPPPWLSAEKLSEPLRCPPTVTREVRESGWINDQDIPSYSDPAEPAITEGPAIKWLKHRGQPGHPERHPLHCASCADVIADILKQELRVGEPNHPLRYKDVWILCDENPSTDKAMIQRLKHHHRLPVEVVGKPKQPLSESDEKELALALKDQIIVTSCGNVQGLERSVVVGMGGDDYETYALMSRTTSLLYYIDPCPLLHGSMDPSK